MLFSIMSGFYITLKARLFSVYFDAYDRLLITYTFLFDDIHEN